MSYNASSTKERYEVLKKDPLIFCKFDEQTEYDDNGRPITRKGWFSCDNTVGLFIDEKELPIVPHGRRLFVIGKEILENGKIDDKKQDIDRIKFEVNEFNANDTTNWCVIFNDCGYNFRSGNTRFCHMSLFWALYHTNWSEDAIRSSLSSVSHDIAQIVIGYIIPNIITLPLSKQFLLANVLKDKKPNITPLIIPEIEEVLKELSPNTDFNNYGLYHKVDYILDYGSKEDEKVHLNTLYKTSHNKYIHFKYWMNTPGHKLYDYNILEFIYSCVHPKVQLSIIKRFLHDVRLDVIEMNYTFLQLLRDVRFKQYVDIRYFIENAGANIDLTAPMFCDSILTLHKNEGEKIQDFNGILDFAVNHSNRAYPGIDLGLRHFLPVCDGGLKPNGQFYGFIHYGIVRTFDESLLTEENLKKTAELILQKNATLQYHYCCSNDNDHPLSEKELASCRKAIPSKRINNKKEIEKVRRECSNMVHIPIYPYRWRRKGANEDRYLSLCIDLRTSKEFLTYEDVDLVRLKNSLLSWGNKTPKIEYFNGHIPNSISEAELTIHFINEYYKPTDIVLYPNKGVFYSSEKSLLGLWQMDNTNMQDEKKRESIAKRTESSVIFQRTFESLKEMYPKGVVYENFIVIPYDIKELQRVKDFFHYSGHIYDPEKGYKEVSNYHLKFLESKPFYYTYFCTPQLADTNDKVSGLPYFWCRSEECFWNMLGNQTLEKEPDWRNYTLYHAAEIIGYKLIETTSKGNVAVETVKNFAAEVRQAERLYSRLICRSCGHMIFSTRGSLLNGSRFFQCANPLCTQYKIEIYLSQCNRCGKGLIDSRDSEKCENGWVICPSCLACCNNSLFNSLIARHRRNGHVPPRLLQYENKGHNDKNIFFCPTCGSKLEMIKQTEITKMPDGTEKVNEIEVLSCLKCNKTYQKEYHNYLHPHNKR